MLGQSPVEQVFALVAGNFVSGDAEQVLAAQSLGRVSLSSTDNQRRGMADLFRLALLEPVQHRFHQVWASEPMLSVSPGILDLNPQPWAVADVDNDGLLELLLVSGDSCRIVHFGPDSLAEESGFIPESRAIDVDVCDMDADSWPELVTLELPFDSAGTKPAVRVWQLTRPELQQRTPLMPLPADDSGMSFSLLGAARLDDYPGTAVIACAEYPSLRPSLYAAVFAAGPDSFAVAANPFPWQEWFRRDEVLPAGSLSLFNVEDTLVAWGYFVPGSRPAGPDRSFAALQDGAWRLLRLAPAAERLAGQVCRYTHAGVPGWLELQGGIFRFYPGDVFIWR